MLFWIELLVLLALIFWGVRKGGIFLTLAGGIGVFIFTFIFRAQMSDPPLTVLRIILCVVLAGGAMQAIGGIDYLVAIAEKILRKHPKSVTILAPIVSWIFVFCCGTGHIVWSILPIVNELAIENGIRPERPIAASIVSSQNAVCATPLAAAMAALIGFMESSGIGMVKILLVMIPATLLGSIAAGVVMLKKGKELADDPEFQRRVADGTLKLEEKHEEKKIDFSKFSKVSKISVLVFLGAMLCVVVLGAVPSLRPVLGNDKALGMTDIIQIFMLVAAAVIALLMRKQKPDAILKTQVFQSGVFAAVITIGLCWMVNIFIGSQSSYLTEVVSGFTNKYPWIFILACYLVGNITTSQASTTAIVIPLGLALGIAPPVLLAGWATIGSHFLIPAASESLAAIAFDTAGTTKIGKFVFNTSYLLPGLVMAVVNAVVAYVLGVIIF